MALRVVRSLKTGRAIQLRSITGHVGHISRTSKSVSLRPPPLPLPRRHFRVSAPAKASIFSSILATSPADMALVPPQQALEWNHTAEDITRLTKKAIDDDRALQDKVAALNPKDCNFDSVSVLPRWSFVDRNVLTSSQSRFS